MDKNKCNSCGKTECACKNKDFTKAVIEIDNPERITLMRKVVIPASMGDDTTVPPVVGKYHNVLLYYEANSKSYLYSSDGIPTQLVNGVTDYEQAVNLPQINGNTLIGDKTGDQLGLQNKLTAGENITIEDDVISATDTTYGHATDTEIGLVKPGDGLEVDTDGTLSISDIEQYAHFFDTVADMKLATNLIAGSYAKTLGFHSKSDGGGVLYKIRTKTGADTPDEMLLIALSDNALIAEAILDNEICPEMFGAYANGSSDDSTAVQKTLDLENSVKFRTGKVYLCNSALTITKRKTIDFSFSTIKVGHSGVGLTIDMETEDVYSHKRFTPSIENLVIDCGNASKGIYIDYAYKGIINNIYINNFLNIGMEKQHGYELVLDNLYFWASNQNTTSIGLLVSGNDCEFGNIFGINCHTGVKITGGANHFKQIHMWLFNDTQGEGMADGDALYAGSAMIDVANNDRNFIDYAYVDSYQYGFKYTGYGYITLNSGFVYCPDLSNLTTDFLNYPFYFIYAEGDNLNYLWRFTINNLSYQKSSVAGLTQKFIPDTYSKRPIRVTNSTIHIDCDNNKKDFIDCFTLNNCTNTNLHATYIGDDQIRIHGVLKKDSSASGWYISKPAEYIPIANNEVIICQTSASQYGSSSISFASINNGTNIAELSTTIPDNYYFIDVILRVIY